MKRINVLVLSAMTLIPAAALYAGTHGANPVTVTVSGGTAISAQGNLADAYNSADANQYIGCGGAATSGWCQAHDATADAPGLINAAFCSTTDPTLIAHIRSISPDSYVRFSIDAATGNCTSIYVSHNSYYRPKAP
jgi:hypothetical protein